MSPPTATWPSSVVVLTVPPRMPAFAAAVPVCTLCTSAPLLTGRFSADSEPSIVQRGQAEVGAAHGAALLELGDLGLGRVDRDREADADAAVAAAAGLDLRVDADHFALRR